MFTMVCKCMVTRSWKIIDIVSCGYTHTPAPPIFLRPEKFWSLLSTRHIKVTNWELLTDGLIGEMHRLCWTSANNLADRFMQNNRCGGGISEGTHGTGRELSLPPFKLQVEQKCDKEVRTDTIWKHPLVKKKCILENKSFSETIFMLNSHRHRSSLQLQP